MSDLAQRDTADSSQRTVSETGRSIVWWRSTLRQVK